MIYLAGPMTGLPEENYPAFREAARLLRAQGHRIISPHESNPCFGNHEGKPRIYFYKRDLLVLLEKCDSIALLPGWEASFGARLELSVARALEYVVYRVINGSLEKE